MLFLKKIMGTVEGYKTRKEQYYPYPDDNIELDEVSDGAFVNFNSVKHRYYVAYEDLCISYEYQGERKRIVLKKVLLENLLDVSDSIMLSYNTIKKKYR